MWHLLCYGLDPSAQSQQYQNLVIKRNNGNSHTSQLHHICVDKIK